MKKHLAKVLKKLSDGKYTLEQLGAKLADIRKLQRDGQPIGSMSAKGGRLYFRVNRISPGTPFPTPAEIVMAYEEWGSHVWAAYSLRMPEMTFRRKYIAAKKALEPKFKAKKSRDAIEITSVGDRIKTVDEAIAKADVDLSIWQIVESEINSWEVAGKMRSGQDDDGRWKPEKLWNQTLWQVKLKLKRRAPKPIQDAIRDLLKDVASPRRPRGRRISRDLLLEIALFDAHFGKLCWGLGTGDKNWDLKAAEHDYVRAVRYLLDIMSRFKFEKILFPLGNDFFHVNNWIGTTAKGTAMDSVDDRFQKVFRAGCRAVRNAISLSSDVAPVEVLWIPGNHDPETSWYMCEWMAAYFRNDKRVTFDNGPLGRKYRRHGTVLLGYTHGDEIKLDKLPLLMAAEEPNLWAATTCRAWRCGHWHKKAATHHTVGDSFNGVRVDILPSLSGTDTWHYKKGLVKQARAAEAYIWSKTSGYVGHFSVGLGND